MRVGERGRGKAVHLSVPHHRCGLGQQAGHLGAEAPSRGSCPVSCGAGQELPLPNFVQISRGPRGSGRPEHHREQPPPCRGPSAHLTLAKKPGSQRNTTDRTGSFIPGVCRESWEATGGAVLPPLLSSRLPGELGGLSTPESVPSRAPGRDGGCDPWLQTHLPATLALPPRSSAAGFLVSKRPRPGEAAPRGGQRRLTPDALPWGERDMAFVFLSGGSW